MASSPIPAQVAHAFNRFGLGARPDDAIPTDPVAWLTSQLSTTDPLANATPSLTECIGWEQAVMVQPAGSAARNKARAALLMNLLHEQENALQNAVRTPTPFWERLVLFWANHFAIMASDNTAGACAGVFVRQAIRPNVAMTFTDMLVAVMQHPAMLNSLNNDVSIGPQSPLALTQKRGGINENLARETLELYTVSINANYTQADIDAFAYMLTGWTIGYTSPNQGFVLDANAHQPGPQTMMGITYPGTPFDAYQVLLWLGTHPLTYQNIATKLVTHFTSDTPDPNDIATVVQALSSTGGSLVAAYNAIIGLANAWVPQTKLRTPFDFTVAALRAASAPVWKIHELVADLNTFGQPLWQPPFPNGWSDQGQVWATGAQMALRTDWAYSWAAKLARWNAISVANYTLGGLISPALSAMLGQLTVPQEQLTVLFCSPEFQRR